MFERVLCYTEKILRLMKDRQLKYNSCFDVKLKQSSLYSKNFVHYDYLVTVALLVISVFFNKPKCHTFLTTL
jgi:hypothetical protein